jgi:sterol desaturase/sphingolipid hydroxylase (fatty acid hydroxylase superfamily)
MRALGGALETTWGLLSNLTSPESTLYWLYLLSAAALVFIVYWVRGYDTENVSFAGFLTFCFPKQIYSHPSAKLDLKYFAVNTVLYGLLIAPMLLTSVGAAHGTVTLLIATFGASAALLPGGVVVDLGVTVAAAVAADLGFFIAHYLQHRVPFLWEFHKVHHAAEVLHPATLYRTHPIHQVLDVSFMGAGTGFVIGCAAYVFGDSLEGVTILGTNAVVFVFNFAGVHLRHSHVRLSYGRFLDRILISPTLHQVHHSYAPQHVDKNYGGMLAVWDWLAGTLYVPRDDEVLTFGLQNEEHREYGSIASLYWLPFAKIAQRWMGKDAQYRWRRRVLREGDDGAAMRRRSEVNIQERNERAQA